MYKFFYKLALPTVWFRAFPFREGASSNGPEQGYFSWCPHRMWSENSRLKCSCKSWTSFDWHPSIQCCLGPIISQWIVEGRLELDRKQLETCSFVFCHGCLSSNMDLLLPSSKHKDEQSTICEVHMQDCFTFLSPFASCSNR